MTFTPQNTWFHAIIVCFVIFPIFISSFEIKKSRVSFTKFPCIRNSFHRRVYYIDGLLASNGNNDQTVTPPTGRRKKKNKYAKFSKVDEESNNHNKQNNNKTTSTSSSTSQNLDPFELLIAESKEKNKQLLKEKAIKNNKKIDSDLLDDDTIQKIQHEKRDRNKRIFPDNKSIDPYDPTTYGYIELGTILGPHGVHGLLKVAAVTDFPERLCKPGIRHLKAPNRRSPREIRIMEGRHRLGDEYLVKLEQIGDRNDALKLRGSVLYARQEERPEDMDDDEYLISELVNMEVRLVTSYGEDYDDAHNDDKSDDKNNYIDDIDFDCTTSTSTSNNNVDNNDNSLGGKFVGIVGGVILGEEMCSIPGLGQDLLEIILPRGERGSPSWKDELVLIPFVPQIVPTIDLDRKILFINPPSGLLDLTYIKEEKIRIKGFLPEKSSWVGN